MSDAFITKYLTESAAALHAFASDPAQAQTLTKLADAIENALVKGRKVMVAGNGGSAADAQHFAAELVSRLFFDRAPLSAIALTTDTSVLTAIGNDYGYERVFERQVQGLGVEGDVFLAISTSGKSPNILRALKIAKAMDIVTLGFGGASGGPMEALCDVMLKAPSTKTPVIQQIHITAAHAICGLVEGRIFPPK